MRLIEKLMKSLESIEEPNDRHFNKMIKQINHCKDNYSFFSRNTDYQQFLRLILQQYPEKLDEFFMTKIETKYLFQSFFTRCHRKETHYLLFTILSKLTPENQKQLLQKIDVFREYHYINKKLFILYCNLILTQHRENLFPKLINVNFLSAVLLNRSNNMIRTVLEAANEDQPELLLHVLLERFSKRDFDLKEGKYVEYKNQHSCEVIENCLHYLAEKHSLEFLVDFLRRLEKQRGAALPSEVFTAISMPCQSNLGIIAAQNKKTPEAFVLFLELIEDLPSELLQDIVTHRNADSKNILQTIAMHHPFPVFFKFLQMLKTRLPDSLFDIFQASDIQESLIASMLKVYSAEDFNDLLQVFNADSDPVFHEFFMNDPGFLGKVAPFYPDLALDCFCHSIDTNNLDAAYTMADAGYTLDYEAFRDVFFSRDHSNAQLLQYQAAFHTLLERKHLIEPEYQNYFRLFTLDANHGFEFNPIPEKERCDLPECCKLILSIVGKREDAEQTMERMRTLSSLNFFSASSQNNNHSLEQVNQLLSNMSTDFILLRTHALVYPKVFDNLLHLASWKALDYQAQKNLLTILDDAQNCGPIEKASAQMMLQFQGQLEDSNRRMTGLEESMKALTAQSARMFQLLSSVSENFSQHEKHPSLG